MNIEYDDDNIEKLCTNSKHAQRRLGAAVKKVLRRRLVELHELDTVDDLLGGVGKWEILKHQELTLSARLDHEWRISVRVTGVEHVDIRSGTDGVVVTIDKHYEKLG